MQKRLIFRYNKFEKSRFSALIFINHDNNLQRRRRPLHFRILSSPEDPHPRTRYTSTHPHTHKKKHAIASPLFFFNNRVHWLLCHDMYTYVTRRIPHIHYNTQAEETAALVTAAARQHHFVPATIGRYTWVLLHPLYTRVRY